MLVHRIPYPPNKGDKIRSYHILKHLSQRYRVHLATFIDDADDWQHVPHVQQLCASSHFANLNPKLARVRSLGALLGRRSLSLDYYRDSKLRAWVDQTVRANKIDRIVVFSSAMAQYAADYPQAHRVVDFVDVDSEKWREYAEKKPWPASLLFRYEATQLLRYEREVAASSDAALFVSAPEAALFTRLAPESTSRIGYFNNGVDTAYFSPDHAYASPFADGERAIVFTGAMDYWPNIDAVEWFTAQVLPKVQQAVPGLRFYIVGARPSPAVQALAKANSVIVTGTVPDVRPYLAHAELSVAPLRVARGIQNKVLEAMAMAKACIVSPQALEGIDATPGSELLLAESPDDFAQAVITQLQQPDGARAVGAAARARVLQRYSWQTNLASIEAKLC
ncbi:TIGR03087 family PEP-CTERM/XrtA system glycosyltransferase [Pseudoduganella ginsengisoli]